MQALIPLAQIALIVAWFTVPSFMALPWYVIFAPALVGLVGVAVWFFLTVVVALIIALWAACNRKG